MLSIEQLHWLSTNDSKMSFLLLILHAPYAKAVFANAKAKTKSKIL